MRKLRVGDQVEVRSREEILRTLDDKAELEGMPFMSEMFAFCGQRFSVYKRAHKTCDYVSPVIQSRRLHRTVHLNTRCDGQSHGGCDAGCLIYWKEAWLKRLPAGNAEQIEASVKLVSVAEVKSSQVGCTESEVYSRGEVGANENGRQVYRCQATQVPYASSKLAWWDLRQYVEDYTSGNTSAWRLFSGMTYALYYNASEAGVGVGAAMRWIYNKLCWLWGGSKWPRIPGRIPAGNPTPVLQLNLQPGELVKVKSQEEILKTVDVNNRNRGMWWDAELVPYCGKTYRVAKSVRKLINEKNGEMLEMKTPGIILESVTCQARYSRCRMFCPRAMYPYWREIWLERASEEQCPAGAMPESSSGSKKA
jgi:hypothetical protein